MEKKLTIAILDYKKANRVIENVSFLLNQKTSFGFDVIVVDNSCDEKNAQILKNNIDRNKIKLVINSKNTGYTKAYNDIAEKISGDYFLILNPDILLKQSDALQKMVEYMDANADVGVLGPKQENDSGELAMTVRAFPRFYVQVARRTFLRHLFWFKEKVAYDEMHHFNYNKIQEVDWLQSSCFITRTSLWNLLGGFNEDYFLFMADAEFCLESWKKGFKVVYYPEVSVLADGRRLSAGGLKTFFQSWILRQHVKDSLRYSWNHLGKVNPRKNLGN